MGKQWKVTDFILGAPKPLQMVTAAMKLKDTCSLEKKLFFIIKIITKIIFITKNYYQLRQHIKK